MAKKKQRILREITHIIVCNTVMGVVSFRQKVDWLELHIENKKSLGSQKLLNTCIHSIDRSVELPHSNSAVVE